MQHAMDEHCKFNRNVTVVQAVQYYVPFLLEFIVCVFKCVVPVENTYFQKVMSVCLFPGGPSESHLTLIQIYKKTHTTIRSW